MLSSEGKPNDTKIMAQVLPDTELQWEDEKVRAEIFQLIESFLSFEACLYHQILPLRFEDKKLILGMVNSTDDVALDYVNRILSYVNCTMVISLIDAEAHRSILSAFLNYKNTSQSVNKKIPLPNPNSQSKQTQSELSTGNLDKSQQEFRFTVDNSTLENQSRKSKGKSTADTDKIYTDSKTATHQKVEETSTNSALITKTPILSVPTPNDFTPVELLPTLPPKRFLEELLGRVIVGGIGRLYFERLPYEGKILWSENGVLQSVLEKLPLSVFQGALNELKRFASLRVTTLSEPKQVEKEYIYQNQRLLLRLRVMPGMYGEEATLQVLKGAALKFYQQQQLSRLSRDALGISQQLSFKLHELQDRLTQSPNTSSEQFEALTTLNRLLINLDSQIKNLTNSEPDTSE
ncbi:MAG: pilus assembly protein PilB [Calothrix sp. C42_A2020_038]|nr:pilus assembly protein PilB [Calothrix sp. C42_A2020_038]